MSASDGASQHRLPSQHAVPPVPFAIYQAYEEALDAIHRPAGELRWNSFDHLWLAQLQPCRQSLQWYRYREGDDAYPNENYEDCGAGESAYKSTTSESLFRRQLNVPKSSVSQQIIILRLDVDQPRNWNFGWGTFGWAADIIGLGLDMPPQFWDHLRSRMMDLSARVKMPVSWQEDSHVLDIGHMSLATLNVTEEQAPTVLVFVPRNWRSYEPTSRFHSPILPHVTPATIHTSERDGLRPATDESWDVWFVRQHIQRVSCTSGPARISPLLICFQSIVEFYLAKAPPCMPFLDTVSEGDSITMKYARYRYVDAGKEYTRPMREVWSEMRSEIDAQRMTLLQFDRFKRRHGESFNAEEMVLFLDLVERFRLHKEFFEISESSLRDRIASFSSELSTTMAVQSIKESKRVILLTAFAFVFLPVSLASSIYGMNIQQINDSGHSITAFVVTAVALCATTFGIWGLLAALISWRNRLKAKYKGAGIPEQYWVQAAIVNWPSSCLPLCWALVRYPFDFVINWILWRSITRIEVTSWGDFVLESDPKSTPES